MSELPWFKFYTEALGDPKFDVVANDNDMQSWEILGIWTALLCIAANSPIRGTLAVSDLRGLGIKNIKSIIGWDDNYWDNTEFQDTYNLERIMQSFIELDMITLDECGSYKIKNFEERQETKEERILRLNRERQKRFQSSHKDEDSVINNVINNADLTQDSISISKSKSNLLSTSLNEKTIFSHRDVEKALLQVLNVYPLPSTYNQHLDHVLDMLQHYGWDETINRLTTAKDNWVSQKNKTNGANYKITNPAWIDYAITGESVGTQPKSIKQQIDDYDQKKIQESIERNQGL